LHGLKKFDSINLKKFFLWQLCYLYIRIFREGIKLPKFFEEHFIHKYKLYVRWFSPESSCNKTMIWRNPALETAAYKECAYAIDSWTNSQYSNPQPANLATNPSWQTI